MDIHRHVADLIDNQETRCLIRFELFLQPIFGIGPVERGDQVVSRILRTFMDGAPRKFQLASATVSS